MRGRPYESLAAAATLASVSLGCGGGVPLMYPARTLSAGTVRASGGASGNFAVGSMLSDLSAARAEAGRNSMMPLRAGSDPTYAKGALILAAVAPGVAPYVSARVGIGAGFEGGITYTGRAAHIDVRRSFDWDDVSLSIGLGSETPVYGNPDTSTLPQVDLSSIHGYGADIPVIVGWQSAARIYMVWGGARFGWDRTDLSALSTEPTDAVTGKPSTGVNEPITLTADRFYGGGVVGMAAGFRHVHAALELDVAYQTLNGAFNGTSVSVQGLSMAPAAALWVTF